MDDLLDFMVDNKLSNVTMSMGEICLYHSELTQLRKCKDALEAMLKCPLIQDAGFVPYIESVLGLMA